MNRAGWKRKPSDFGDQLNWCEMCSVALKVPANNANEDTDIVSPKMLKKLKEVNGPKIRKNQFVILDTKSYDPKTHKGHKADPIWYFPEDQRDEARISPDNSLMFPHSIDVALREGESEKTTVTREQVNSLNFRDWVAIFEDPEAINEKFLESAAHCVLNPGCIYSYEDQVWLLNRRAHALRANTSIKLDVSLIKLWERKKRVQIKRFPEIGKMTLTERVFLKLKQLAQRGAFLLPVFKNARMNRF